MATAVLDLSQTSPLRPQAGRTPVRPVEVCEITYQLEPKEDGKLRLAWQAARCTRPTPLQHKVGIRCLVNRSTGEALGIALDRMVQIAHDIH
jgi:hypothetical protein